MSSGQGSIANNTSAGFEVYRATKSALSQLMKSYAVRHADDARSLLLMAPGWVKTEMGGPHAMLEISDSIPPLVDTVEVQRGTSGPNTSTATARRSLVITEGPVCGLHRVEECGRQGGH